MNKKIFAALASATMALSATGSLAVFAEDFDVVDEANGTNSGAAGVVVPNSGVEFNTENFPDAGMREWVSGAVGGDKGLKYGATITKEQLENVTEFRILPSMKDAKGIEYFTKITDVVMDNKSVVNNLESCDLSNNTELETIDIENVPYLSDLNLPETTSLTVLTVIGSGQLGAYNDGTPRVENAVAGTKAPIAALDLSNTPYLTKVTISNTDIASLDLSSRAYLTDIFVSNNKLNTLNLVGSHVENLYCANNYLYELTLPKSPDLAVVVANNNILQDLDITGLTGLTKLQVADNELKELDFTKVGTKNPGNVVIKINNNHIGAVNLTNYNPTNLTTSPQWVYVNSSYNGVNLEETFPDINLDKVHPAQNKVLDKDSGVLTLVKDADNSYTYDYGSTNGMAVYVLSQDVLNRLYNPNSGEHFYTKDVEEKDTLVNLGWKDEGIGWVSPTTSNRPVYRLYNPNAGDHHYTMSSTERDVLVSVGWKAEGIGWYSYNEGAVSAGNTAIPAIAVMREYNPNAKAAGAHNYTVNRAENDFLVSVGWLDEGLAWNAMK